MKVNRVRQFKLLPRPSWNNIAVFLGIFLIESLMKNAQVTSLGIRTELVTSHSQYTSSAFYGKEDIRVSQDANRLTQFSL